MSEPYLVRRSFGGFLFRRQERGKNGDPLLSVSQERGVIPQEEAGRRNIASADKSTYWRVYPGDIVYNTMRMWQGASSSSEFFGIVSPAYTVCQPVDGVSSKYLAYLLKHPDCVRRFEARSQGITSDVWNLRFSEFEKIQADFVAQEKHRQRIAEILSTVDEAIEQTEALIVKYQQIKTGLMHDLFTCGLSPEASAKGGVTWKLRPTRAEAPHLYKESLLGWIPKEWELQNLGLLAEIVSGVTLGMESETKHDLEVPYLRVANVQDGFFDLTEVKTIRVSRSEFDKLQLRNGDVLMNEGGDFDKLGRGSVWNEEIVPCIHQNHVFRVRPKPGVLKSYYLSFWSQSEFGKKYFVLSSKQSTNLASINSSQLHRFPIAVPLSEEQHAIELRIFSMNERIISLSDEVSKLRLLKQGLMHDLLTSRVRVKLEQAETSV